MRQRLLVLTAGAAVFLSLFAPAPAGAGVRARWVAAWSAPITDSALATLGGAGGTPANATFRNIAYVTVGGPRVRVRLSNAFGEQPLQIGAAWIALRDGDGADIDLASSRRITFGGKAGVTIKPKTDALYSDPIAFNVKALQIVAVSLYMPSETNPAASTANYNTSYQSDAGSGDKTRAPGSDFGATSGSTYALTAIDVLTKEADGAIVGLGSSSFHGTASTRDQYIRVLDSLSRRVKGLIASGKRKSVISAGIGGDTLNASLTRLDRDVLTQTGISGVIVYNINDIGQRRTAEQIIEDYRIVIRRAHRLGVLVFCPTWPPAAQSQAGRVTQERSKLNAWILESGECDDVVDWNVVLEDQTTHETYRPQYFADGIHPNDAGHIAMAEATPKRWFTLRYQR